MIMIVLMWSGMKCLNDFTPHANFICMKDVSSTDMCENFMLNKSICKDPKFDPLCS